MDKNVYKQGRLSLADLSGRSGLPDHLCDFLHDVALMPLLDGGTRLGGRGGLRDATFGHLPALANNSKCSREQDLEKIRSFSTHKMLEPVR